MQKSPISKSALAIVLVGFIFIAGLIALGLQRQAKPQTGILSASKTANTNTPAPAPIPVPAAAPAVTNIAEVEPDNGVLPPVIPISLTNVVIEAENGTWSRDKDYLVAPHEPKTFGGVYFLMDGMIQLQGRLSKEWKNRSYRTTIVVPLALTNVSELGTEIVQRGTNVSSLHLLGATRYGSNEEKTFVQILWRYTDGTSQLTPVEYCTHFRDWVRNPYEEPAHLPYPYSKVVWTADQPSQPGHALRLYRVTFANPAPEKIVKQLEFTSAMEDPTLFLVGITLDPLKPGRRPDSSPDLEPTDPVPPKKVEIVVQSADGQALPQSKLSIQFDQLIKNKSVRTSGFLTTDANGIAQVNYPPSDLEQLSISAGHDDYGSRKIVWDLKSGDTVPANYTLKLGSCVNIGGIIVDESDAPLEGVKVSTYRFWTGSDDGPDRKGEQADFSSKTATTDAQGVWQAKGLPTELLDHIGFSVKHPDYLSTNMTVGRDSAIEKLLRAGTFKMVLHRGLDVRGLVKDINDYPIIGATVWAGLRYYSDRQQVKTGHDGRFAFHNVSGGDVVFSVSAKGHQPDSKTVTVDKDTAEIVFKLPAGKTIRAVVQDESGTPIPGARVILEGNGDSGRTYEFSANTDKDGRFTWDAAPDGSSQFYIGKDGYEAKRDYKLEPDTENVVTLHPPRQLHGQVVDADTGQPVTKFSVRTGTASDNDTTVYGVINDRSFTAADGKFTMDLTEENDNAVAVQADGYTDKLEKFPAAQGSTVSVTVRMKASAGLSGVVLAPDGTPAPGVTVTVASEGNHNYFVQLTDGRLRSFDSHNTIATTDADGHFKLNTVPDDGTVVAAGDAGFARAPLADIRGSQTIRLQAWGRIEGTLKIGGQPGAGKDLVYSIQLPGIDADFNGYKATTDEQGKFTIEKVPPGDGSIARLIRNTPRSWSYSDSTTVTIKAGETTQVTLGDNGAVIVGRIRYEVQLTNESRLTIEGNLNTAMPQQPPFNSPDEAKAFYQSPEWQALMKLHKNYSIEMRPDGSFNVDDVAPGNYTLNVSARVSGQHQWEHPPAAQGSGQVTVPDSFNPASPIDMGEILLSPPPPQQQQQ